MEKTAIQSKIELSFRKQVQNDKKVKNAYLLVHSDKLNIHLNIAEGETGNSKAHETQPNHLASVGKLLTATIISMLFERELLDFNDSISRYLDSELMNQLHVYKGKDYSAEITIRHLLMQTSGLNDVFMGFPTVGFNYGYSIWKLKSIPIIMPEKYRCWGCVGATGAFMFYHPATEAHIIGTFNDFSYRGKALQFMARKVIKELLKYGSYRIS